MYVAHHISTERFWQEFDNTIAKMEINLHISIVLKCHNDTRDYFILVLFNFHFPFESTGNWIQMIFKT